VDTFAGAIADAPMTTHSASTFFRTTFDGDPDLVASSAGRVNLIGEHLDYNGGEVLPMAIERRTQIAIRHARNGTSVAASSSHRAVGRFDAERPERAGHWWDYVAGVADSLRREGVHVPQFEAAIWSDVPSGAGLSSSAALEVATGTALNALAGTSLSLKTIARAGWRAENEFVGVPCGIMDQFASALGAPDRALHIWCDTEASEQVPFTAHVLIFDTAVKRSLRTSDFQRRREECEEAFRRLRQLHPELRNLASATPDMVRDAHLPEPLDRRALHVTEENVRVQQAVAALKESGTIPGELLYASHRSLRDLYQCSTPELDWFVEEASHIPGIDGARLTGAGWGGCAIAIGTREALERAASELPEKYERAFGREPRTWITRAAAGARVESP